MRIVFYAVNGSGVGHLMRCIAIARNMRKLASERDLKIEIFFLTTSEATGLLFSEGFPAFKLPSRETLTRTGFSIDEFLRIASEWTRKTLELLKPDLLVVDTFPAGYYNELADCLPLARHTAIVSRPVKFSNIDETIFLKNLELYDAVVVPETRESSKFVFPTTIEHRVRHFGAILSREKDELLERETVRQKLRITSENLLIYLSAGGGGDDNAGKIITHVYESLRDLPNIHFVIGAGPLYRKERFYGRNITWLANENVFEMVNGFDLAIASAGYNSFHELMFAGIPCIFFPQAKWADDQTERARRAVHAGAATMFDELPSSGELRQAFGVWLDEDRRTSASRAARNLVPRNFASEVALYLLEGSNSSKT